MVRYIPQGIRKIRQLSRERQRELWLTFLSERLDISVEEARERINEIRALPLKEEFSAPIMLKEYNAHPKAEVTVVTNGSPRYEAAADLLADLSSWHPPVHRPYRYSKDGHRIIPVEGPRGSRPLLVTADNIASLLDVRRERVLRRICEIYGGIDELILKLGLTASNPEYWEGKDVQFTHQDIRRGVYLPEKSELPLARALGPIEAHGTLRDTKLTLVGRPQDKLKYTTMIPNLVERAFNLRQDMPYESQIVSSLTGTISSVPRLRYTSKALSGFLRFLDFPANLEETSAFGFNRAIWKFNSDELRSFLHYFLPFAATFTQVSWYTAINHRSKLKLQQLQELLYDFLNLPPPIAIKPNSGNTYQLRMSKKPTVELYERDFFSARPLLTSRIEARLGGALSAYG